MGESQTISVISLDLIPYEQALARQRERLQKRAKDLVGDALFLCQHPEVVTVGRALKESSMAVAGATLAGIPVVNVSRGGQATLHLPGQLVGYPILKMDGRNKDLHRLLRMLEELLIQALDEIVGLKAIRRGGGLTGVWIEDRKIASIGIAVERWVSFHGFALNVSNDLSRFQLITPCGLSPDVMTSIEKECSKSLAENFLEAFPDFAGPRLSQLFWSN
jgi:lipoyl(octanoyl) transferase